MNKKSFFLIIIAALSVVTFWNITASNSRNSKTQVKAAATTHFLSISFLPLTQPMQVGDTQTVSVTLTPSTQTDNIEALYLKLVSDNGLQILDISPPMSSSGNMVNFIQYVQTVKTNSVEVAYDFTGNSTTTYTPPHIIIFNVRVKKTIAASPWMMLYMDSQNSQAFYGYDPSTYYSGEFSWGTIDYFAATNGSTTATVTPVPSISLTPTAVQSPTLNPTIILSGVPTNVPIATCQELSAPQNLTPSGTIFVTAEGQKISWDPVVGAKFYGIEIWEESKNKPTGTTGIPYTKIFTSSTTETFYIYKQFAQDKNYLIKVYAVDACNNAWSPSQQTISVLGAAPTLTPTNVPYPSATPTQTIPPVTIKMRLRLQGMYSKPTRNPKTAQIFLVWVRNADRENPIYKWVTATYDQIGSWFISDTWNLVPGDGYKVWVKGEKHLQRKICDGKPSDQESGFYHCFDETGQIVIRPGENYLDFSNVIMFAGDIPFKGEGDGVLDAFDLSYIATHFGDTATDIGDLNFDGITDSQDFGIAVNAIRVQKYDETYPYKIHPFFRQVPLHPQFP